jgi:hypothetical protein
MSEFKKTVIRVVSMIVLSLSILYAPLSLSENIYLHIYTAYMTVGVVTIANLLVSFIIKD